MSIKSVNKTSVAKVADVFFIALRHTLRNLQISQNIDTLTHFEEFMNIAKMSIKCVYHGVFC